MSIMIQVSELHFSTEDGVKVLEDIHLRVDQGELMVILGPAASGKSLLLGLLGAQIPPQRGQILVDKVTAKRQVQALSAVIAESLGGKRRPFLVLDADPVRGKEIALSQIDRDADVVFHAAGVTGLGVIEAAKARDRLAIGVDSNQNHVAPGHVLTSMIKRVDNAIYAEIASGVNGVFRGGLVDFGLAEDGVGYAVDEYNRDLLSDEILARVDALRDSIIAGEIDVPFETDRK